MRQKRTYEELKGTEKECFELLSDDKRAIDDNTEWCIKFWSIKSLNRDTSIYSSIIRKYPPESLTKYRRNLVADGLITPSEKSIEHSREMEAKNHSQAKEIHDQQAHKIVSGVLFPNQSMQ